MKHGKHPDLFATHLVDDDKWEPSYDRSASMSMHDRIHLRAAQDAPERFLDTEHELRIKSLTLSSIPPNRLLEFSVCLRVEPDTHGAVSGTS